MSISFRTTHLGIVYVILGLVAGYEGATLALAAARPATSKAGSGSASDPSSSAVSGDRPVITIEGLCDHSRNDGIKDSHCETVINAAQFAKIIDAIQPKMSARARREFALNYAEGLILAKKAESLGLDKGAKYDEQMKIARIQVLSKDLKGILQENATLISDEEIEAYYRRNTARFEKAKVDRIYVPRNRQQVQPTADINVNAKEIDIAKRLEESGEAEKREADELHTRALHGEEFVKLQSDAYQAAGITTAIPNTTMEIRRVSLPPNQVSVMGLSPGEVSPVFEDANGFSIYKMKTKEVLPLDQAREEIKARLRTERFEAEMRGLHESTRLAINEGYFHR